MLDVNKLSKRQLEYLALVSMGFSNVKIAEILSVSESCVKKTLEEIFKKLNGVDRVSMVDNARERGILTNKIKHSIAIKYDIRLPITRRER